MHSNDPTIKKGERTRRRILTAAIELISCEGIEKTTTREIARVAGVTKGLVSHYFEKREDLFTHVVDHMAMEGYRQIEAVPDGLKGLEKIIWMYRQNVQFFLNNPNFSKCFLLFYYYASFVPELKQMNETLRQRAIERLQQYISQHLSEQGQTSSPTEILRVAEILQMQLYGELTRTFSTPRLDVLSKAEIRDSFLQTIVDLLAILKTSDK